ncbi:MAG: hypothetical protein QQN63_11225, partial [Nitrosopumilus sp.]
TEGARHKIKDREFRYMSADFNTKFIDNETGKDFGPTLNGAALTNNVGDHGYIFIKVIEVLGSHPLVALE